MDMPSRSESPPPLRRSPTMVDEEGIGAVVDPHRMRLRLIQNRPMSPVSIETPPQPRPTEPIHRLRVAQRKGDLAAVNEALAASAASIGSIREMNKLWRAALFEDAQDDDEIAASRLQSWQRRSAARSAERVEWRRRQQQLLHSQAEIEANRHTPNWSFRLRHYQQPWWHSNSESASMLTPESLGRPLMRSPRGDRVSMQIESIHEQIRQRVRNYRLATRTPMGRG